MFCIGMNIFSDTALLLNHSNIDHAQFFRQFFCAKIATIASKIRIRLRENDD